MNNIFKYIILLFCVFPLLPNNIKGLPVVLLLIFSIFCLIKNKKVDWYRFIIYSSLYLIYLFSLLYTINIYYGVKVLETRLSLLIIPLAFSFLNISIEKRERESLLKNATSVFYVSTILYCFFIIIFLWLEGAFNAENPLMDFRYHIQHNIPFIGQHPIYASIFISLALIVSVNLLKDYKYSIKSWLIVLGNIFLLGILLILAQKGSVIGLLICLIYYWIYSLKKNKKSILLIIFTVGLVLVFIPTITKRFTELFSVSSYKVLNVDNSSSLRYTIYKNATNKILEKPIFGYGVGDAKDVLVSTYNNHEMIEEKYNSHNQYLSIWMSTGAVGLIIFLFFLYYNFKIARKEKSSLFFLILLYYSVILLTENILERQSGVILFAFLITFLGYINMKKINE
ncbi:O-antigen ligase family protein [Flavivirga algicola]|uniref:O-antigen ligase family protein n=1 Tax=Flavivirga algicola TaxID=2729136 RepID=A0ABX1S0E3_9FLAO|nr:O-antigen ligase family protein [Flavivirga algicola]NMH89325.1 O-antigen ligase family protein [Flavivirga algicola]